MSSLIDLHRMAKRLRVSPSWLKREAKAGNVPSLKAGAKYLFNPTAVVEALSIRAANSQGRSQEND